MENNTDEVQLFHRIIKGTESITDVAKEGYLTELQQVTISASCIAKFTVAENASCAVVGILTNGDKVTIAVLNRYNIQQISSTALNSFKSVFVEWHNFKEGILEISGVYISENMDNGDNEMDLDSKIREIAGGFAAENTRKQAKVTQPKDDSTSSDSSSDDSSSSSSDSSSDDSSSDSSSDDSSSDSSDSSSSSDDSSDDEKKKKGPGSKKIKQAPAHKEHKDKRSDRDGDRRSFDRRGDDRRGGDRRGDDRRGGDRRGDDRRGGDRRGGDRRGNDRRGDDRRGGDRRGGDRPGFRSFNRDNNSGGKMNCYNCSYIASDKTELLKHKKSAHPFK